MTHHHRSTGLDNPQRLVWVAIIAAVASLLTGYLRWESLPVALLVALAAAILSVIVVLVVDRLRAS